jgi:hypothetical protein
VLIIRLSLQVRLNSVQVFLQLAAVVHIDLIGLLLIRLSLGGPLVVALALVDKCLFFALGLVAVRFKPVDDVLLDLVVCARLSLLVYLEVAQCIRTHVVDLLKSL